MCLELEADFGKSHYFSLFLSMPSLEAIPGCSTWKLTHSVVTCINLPVRFNESLSEGARVQFWIVLAHFFVLCSDMLLTSCQAALFSQTSSTRRFYPLDIFTFSHHSQQILEILVWENSQQINNYWNTKTSQSAPRTTLQRSKALKSPFFPSLMLSLNSRSSCDRVIRYLQKRAVEQMCCWVYL